MAITAMAKAGKIAAFRSFFNAIGHISSELTN